LGTLEAKKYLKSLKWKNINTFLIYSISVQ
jgi:hypothetical protein